MDWTEGGPTPYEILGITNGEGPDASPEEIKKTFRKLAVLKHPDKNRNNKNAAAEFAEIDKAYRILLDAAARAALDDWLRARIARKARDDQGSDKRRKLKEELEVRERRVASEKNEEEEAKIRLRSELDRLRKRAQEEEKKSRQQAAELASRSAVPNASSLVNDMPHEEACQAQLRRSLKVSWDPSLRDYNSEQLRQIFALHGLVEDVVLKDRKKKRKANAFIVMSTEAEAMSAIASVCGDINDPLLVTPLLKSTPNMVNDKEWDEGHAPTVTTRAPGALKPLVREIFGGPMGRPMIHPESLFPSGQPVVQISSTPLFPSGSKAFPSAPTSGFSSFPGFGGGAPRGPVASSGGFEGAVLDKMRREAERKRALSQAESENS